MQVILPIQQWRHFRQHRVNQLAERDTHRHQRISKDTKRTPKVRNFIFNNEVPKSGVMKVENFICNNEVPKSGDYGNGVAL